MQVGYSGAGVRTVTSIFLLFVMMLCGTGACAAEVTIRVNASTMTPPAVVIRKGDSVRWNLISPMLYRISSYDGDWASPPLRGNAESYARVFGVAGDYTYRVSDAETTNAYNFLGAGQVLVSEDGPEVMIHSPIENQVLNTSPFWVHMFIVSSTSTLALERVELLSGEQKVSEVVIAPFDAVRWTNPPVGVHSMRVRVSYEGGKVMESPARTVEFLSGSTFSAHMSEPTRLRTGEFRFYYTLPTYNFLMEYSDDLKTWQKVVPGRYLYEPSIWVDETATNSPVRFYRLAHEPG